MRVSTVAMVGGICGTWNMKETDRVKQNTIIIIDIIKGIKVVDYLI
jgi:hypothetical protein